jgi:hypothetical protein
VIVMDDLNVGRCGPGRGAGGQAVHRSPLRPQRHPAITYTSGRMCRTEFTSERALLLAAIIVQGRNCARRSSKPSCFQPAFEELGINAPDTTDPDYVRRTSSGTVRTNRVSPHHRRRRLRRGHRATGAPAVGTARRVHGRHPGGARRC